VIWPKAERKRCALRKKRLAAFLSLRLWTRMSRHLAVLVHGTPEVMGAPVDPDEDLVEVPVVAWAGAPVASAIGVSLAKL